MVTEAFIQYELYDSRNFMNFEHMTETFRSTIFLIYEQSEHFEHIVSRL